MVFSSEEALFAEMWRCHAEFFSGRGCSDVKLVDAGYNEERGEYVSRASGIEKSGFKTVDFCIGKMPRIV